MARIAISYRRSDSQDITGRIFDRLVRQYGKHTVFRDIDSIQPGIDFRTQISDALSATDILLVVVGTRWLGRGEGGANRIDNEADPCRIEVETALRRGIPIIPILVGGMTMPEVDELPASLKDFAYRHAVTVDGGRDFDHHVEGLIGALDRFFAGKTAPPQREVPPSPAPLAKYGLIGVVAVVVLVIAGALLRNATTQTATTIQPVMSQTTPAPQAAPVAAASVTPSVPSAAPQIIAPAQPRTADIPVAATPAFDCSKSHAPDEQAVCHNGQLSYLDQELNVLFDGLRSRLDRDQQAVLWAQEQAWLKQRGVCGPDVGCLRDAYQSRIAQLQSWH